MARYLDIDDKNIFYFCCVHLHLNLQEVEVFLLFYCSLNGGEFKLEQNISNTDISLISTYSLTETD